MTPWQQGSVSSSSFQPYVRSDVPALKDLIVDPHFGALVEKQPYILGISGNQRYLAWVVLERKTKAYRLDVFDLKHYSLVQSLYMPLRTDYLKQKQELDDYVNLIQNTVKIGYRITLGVKPTFLIPGHNQDLAGHGSIIFNGAALRVSLSTPAGGQWTVAKGEWTGDEEDATAYTFPLSPGKEAWGVIVFVRRQGNESIAAVSSFVPEEVLRSPSDQQLTGFCQSILSSAQPCRLFIRGTGGQRWFLAGIEKERIMGNEQTRYAGEAWQFAVCDFSGKRLVIGGKEGIVEGNRPISPEEPVSYYRVMLLDQNDAEETQRLIVDVYNRRGDLFRTLEWVWNRKIGQFELVEGDHNGNRGFLGAPWGN
jgi:hypothetical protein